jgi:hypothetical protein
MEKGNLDIWVNELKPHSNWASLFLSGKWGANK